MIKALTWERAYCGQDLDKLRNVLIEALAATKQIEDDCVRFAKVYRTSEAKQNMSGALADENVSR
jgi:hypothetical protein